MGHQNHIDLELLEQIEELVARGVLDTENDRLDAQFVAIAKAIAEEEEVTPEQQAVFDARIATLIGRLQSQQEEEWQDEHMSVLLGKDD